MNSVMSVCRASSSPIGMPAPKHLTKFIMEEVKAFANQPVQYDDITLLVIKMK